MTLFLSLGNFGLGFEMIHGINTIPSNLQNRGYFLIQSELEATIQMFLLKLNIFQMKISDEKKKIRKADEKVSTECHRYYVSLLVARRNLPY